MLSGRSPNVNISKDQICAYEKYYDFEMRTITDPETCFYTSCTVRFGTLFVQRGPMHHTCTLFKRNLDTICFEFSHPTDLQ